MAEETQIADAPPDLEPGTQVAGYVIDRKLGEGGMGVVYEASQKRIGKRVAIKVLTRTHNDPAALERFEQEAQFVNAIRHPNIVDVFQFGELPDSRAYFVMELLEGESLAERLKRRPLSVREAVVVLDAVCDALEAAHEKNVIHRDLKADNVFLVRTRGVAQIKLLDFGLAKLSTTKAVDDNGIHKTRSGILVGTPAYMAPEQARGKGVDPRTDIYSLGVLAYKMLTGQLPYSAETAMDLIVMHLNAPVPSIRKLAPDTPPVLDRMVMRMMAKERDERPSLAEIRQLLATLRDGSPAASNPQLQRRRSSLPIVLSLLLCGVIAFGVVGIVRRYVLEPTPSHEPASPTQPPATGSNHPTPAVTQPAPAPAIEMEPEVRSPKRVKRETPSSAVEEPAAPVSKIGSIVVALESAAEIEIDGVKVADASRGGRFPVLPGKHVVRIKPPVGPVVERTVSVTDGGSILVELGDSAPKDNPDPVGSAAPTKPPE